MQSNIINGWEYSTSITPTTLPTEKKLQDTYVLNYNSAYDDFIQSLLLPTEQLDTIVNMLSKTIDSKTRKVCTKYKYIIDCSNELDFVNNSSDYPIKFQKSKFLMFKDKKIRTHLINYYKPLGFYVKGPIELINNNNIIKYYIELYWKVL